MMLVVESHRTGISDVIATCLLVAVGWASTAEAATPVAMMGRWFDRRGIGTFIPIAKGGIPNGPTPFGPYLPDFVATAMTSMGLAVTRTVAPPSAGALFRHSGGIFARGAGAGGTKPAAQSGTSVGTAGKPPSRFTIAGRFWDIPAAPFLIPLQPQNVLDAFTSFGRAMPVASSVTPMGALPGVSAMLFAGPKASRPATFTFCPNAGPTQAPPGTFPTAVSCLSPIPTGLGGGGGTRPGLVRYKAGPNQFGGVMNSVMTGGAFMHVIPGTGVVTVADPRPSHTGATLMLAAKRALGRTLVGPWGGQRQRQNTTAVDSAPIYGITATNGGIVTGEIGAADLDPGPEFDFAATPMNAFGVMELNEHSKNWGFPVTTGTITVSFHPASVTGPPDHIIVSAQ